jgi:sigma-B regulation protein RsbU (phosphoserine phosphatase)
VSEARGRSFRAVVTLGAVLLVGGVGAATLAVGRGVLERVARQNLERELTRGGAVFADLHRYRESLYKAQARIVADEPRLKAVVDARDITRETVLGVAYDLKKAIATDLLLLTDGTGHLIADVAAPEAEGFDLSDKPLVASAIEHGEGRGIWTQDGRVYQMEAQRMSFGGKPVGVAVIGYAIDDKVAETIFRQTGDAVAIIYDGHVAAMSAMEHGERADAAQLAAQLGAVPDGETREIALGGRDYIARAAAFPSYSGPKPLRFALLRSLDRAREPARYLLSALGGVAVAASIVALICALVFSRGLARPLDELVGFTGRLSAGRLEERVRVRGPRELVILGEAMNRMAGELQSSRSQLAEKERMARDLELAARIQTSILPSDAKITGLEIGARMIPAESVGGDYYDVFAAPGGAWIGIGDVAGHGVSAGLVMLMVQSVVSALVREKPHANPSELVAVLNEVLYDNVQLRMKQDEHVTFTLLRYLDEGRLIFAGAHEELVVWRKAEGRCEQVATLGTWIGVVPDIRHATHDAAIPFLSGDVLLLYSDGLIQAMNAAGDQYGLRRLSEHFATLADKPAQEIADAVVQEAMRFGKTQDDDVSVLVVRRA